jgi:methyl-accepting chemotaxis protein
MQIMKHSIRTRFAMGMIFLFLIILVLAVFSGYYVNRLSGKTSAILKENYLSVVYSREMSEGIMSINQELTTDFLMNSNTDSMKIIKGLNLINRSLLAEKNNITEPGEDKLVSDIESDFNEYRGSVSKLVRSSLSAPGILSLQNISDNLYSKLQLLSQMNGNAIQSKTDDAKSYSKRALTQMTILASFCFLIGMSFTFSFASYFSQRFFQLYNGIKDLVSSNFDQHLYFNGNDEFYEISLVFNEMADKLKENKQKMSLTLQEDSLTADISENVKELKQMLSRIRSMEEEAVELISKFKKN